MSASDIVQRASDMNSFYILTDFPHPVDPVTSKTGQFGRANALETDVRALYAGKQERWR